MTRSPLGYGQRLLQLLDGREPGTVLGPTFTNTMVYRLTGPLEPELLARALESVVAARPELRTTIAPRAPFGEVRAVGRTALTVTDLRAASAEAGLDAVATRFAADLTTRPAAPLPHGQPPPEAPDLDAQLGQLADTEWVLRLTAHHAAVDERSFAILIAELSAAYQRQQPDHHAPDPIPPGPPGPPRPDEHRIRAALAFWRTYLTDPSPWPATHTVRSRHRARHAWTAPPGYAADLARAARTYRTTPFAVLLAGHLADTADRTGATDLTVPVLTAGRGGWNRDAVGFHVNAVPVRVDLSGAPGRPELIRRTHLACATAYANEVPTTRLIEAVPAAGGLLLAQGAPYFQLLQRPAGTTPPGGLGYRILNLPPEIPMAGSVPVDQVWTLRMAAGLDCWVVHDDGLLPPAEIAARAARLAHYI